MIGILEAILCAIQELAGAILALLVLVVNAAIVAIGLLISGIFLLLPEMPEPPAPPSGEVMQWLLFFVPLASMVTVVVGLAVLFAGFLAVRFLLTYFRAL